VITTTTSTVEAISADSLLHAQSMQPAGEAAPASAASPTMPLRMPIEVMPIWIVDRKRVGFLMQLDRHRRRSRRHPPQGQPARRARAR
jgi:hypothetical protein